MELDGGHAHLATGAIGNADDVGLLHGRMSEQDGLHLERRDVDAAGLDQFLQPAAEADAPVVTQQAEVARHEEPVVVEGRARLLRIAIVPRCDVPLHAELAHLAGGQSRPVAGSTTRISIPGSGRPWVVRRSSRESWASVTAQLPYVSVAP